MSGLRIRNFTDAQGGVFYNGGVPYDAEGSLLVGGGFPYLLYKSNVPVSRTSVNGAGDATPSDLMSVTLTAGVLVGSTTIFVYGLINSVGDASKTYSVKLGGTSMGSLAVTATNVNQLAQFIHANNSSVGQISPANPQTAFHAGTSGALGTNNQDCTLPVDLTITIQWAGATSAETVELLSAMVWVFPGQ